MYTALALPRVQPPPRAARKSEWLRSALLHHHCPDPGAENEIVVLATGIDQYLQEVFHHLVYPSPDETVSAEDFSALCAALGLHGAPRRHAATRDEQREEFEDVCSGLPDQLTFKDFHSRLCGFFRARCPPAGPGGCAWRLPVSEDTELVERQIRLRWPRVRRRKCVSFDLTRDQRGVTSRSARSRTTEEVRQLDEVAALRELVEDLRSALQGSDARCLALEVALRRERSRTISTASASSASTTLVPADRLTEQLGGAQEDGARRTPKELDMRDPILRELKMIRSSRDGQLEEAIRFNKRLEEELQWAYQEVRRLQQVESSLRKENTQIRKRAEEAREALRLGLKRVQLIQEQAQSVPQLQSRISELESELLQYRSSCTRLSNPEGQLSSAEDSCSKTGAECLQRAVEGRAASDEEEEDKRGQCCQLEAKRHDSHLHGCGKRQLQDAKHSRECCSLMGPKQHEPHGSRGSGKGKRPEDEEDRTRLQETGRMRLSLLEDKLTDSLTLLLSLRNKVRPRPRRPLTPSASACSPVTPSETEGRTTREEDRVKRNMCFYHLDSRPAVSTLCSPLVKSADCGSC